MDDEFGEAEFADTLEPCWPFWGLLEKFESPSHSRLGTYYTRVELRNLQPDSFKRFALVGRQALRMLGRRTICELRSAASEIQSEIESFIDYYIEAETKSLVESLCERGGYQLEYLPEEARGSEYEIRNLLANWSAEWDDTSGLPRRDDLSDLEALSDCLGWNWYDEKELIHFGLIEPEEHEFYAVLALMIICDAIHSNPLPIYPKSESLSQVMAIGHATINAIEAIAHADRIQFEGKIRKAVAAEQPAILAAELNKRINDREIKAKKKLSDAGVKGSEIRHALSKELKDWALMEGKKLKGLPTDKARELMKRLPLGIAEKLKEAGDKLKDPERVIRDALAAQRNK
jgi:hypothetical protein